MYNSLSDIAQRKQQLRLELSRDSQKVDRLWNSLFVKRNESTRGQFLSNIISHSALAIDAFLMVRKLRKTHPSIFQALGNWKKKK